MRIERAENAKKNYELANSFADKPSDLGPFYHGTRADLQGWRSADGRR
jgi:rifampin ADP-ribosylating transferase